MRVQRMTAMGLVAVLVPALVAGCTSGAGGGAETSSAPTASSGAPGPQASSEATPATEVTTVVDGLDAPWGLAPLPDGGLLVTLRDAARLVVVDPEAGTTTDVTGPGADQLAAQTVPGGEAGLLGVAVDPASGEVFVYRSGADDNAVLRGTLDGTTLGDLATVVDGIPRASNHDGGRLAFGPDGYLYVSTGDASDSAHSQDPASLGGKILRLTADGDPAPGNPDPASLVWSLGHRNVQGLGWDDAGHMFASEFGQNTYDELNVIVPGANYGWPDVEGPGGQDDGFVAPVAWWTTDEASPSGLAVTDRAVYLAGLRGQTLWRVPLGEGAAGDDAPDAAPDLGEPQALLAGELGRLRAVVPVTGEDADGLWVLTNNTDGRGSPRDGDDRLVLVTPAQPS